MIIDMFLKCFHRWSHSNTFRVMINTEAYRVMCWGTGQEVRPEHRYSKGGFLTCLYVFHVVEHVLVGGGMEWLSLYCCALLKGAPSAINKIDIRLPLRSQHLKIATLERSRPLCNASQRGSEYPSDKRGVCTSGAPQPCTSKVSFLLGLP